MRSLVLEPNPSEMPLPNAAAISGRLAMKCYQLHTNWDCERRLETSSLTSILVGGARSPRWSLRALGAPGSRLGSPWYHSYGISIVTGFLILPCSSRFRGTPWESLGFDPCPWESLTRS